MKFNILHTNDIHSRFENFASINTKIKELRDKNTLVLDAGDFNDFMRIELQGTLGKAGTELLELAGYDAIAIAIGNNEGFAGIEAVENLANTEKVKFLSCNLYKCKFGDALEPINGVKRSIIINKQGIRFLIIGTSPYGNINEFFNLSGLHATDALVEIKKELEANRGKYDLCILLSHCGMKEDTDIANEIEGINIIINGHSHILMKEALKINNSIVHMSGQYGEHLGKLEIEYDGFIRGYKGENISVEGIESDKKLIKNLTDNKRKAINKLSEPLYNIDRHLWHDVVEENPISNLLADALRDVLKCDIGIINSGVLNGGIRKGIVSKKKLLEICHSPLNPTYIEVQGKDIKKAFQNSIDADYCMKDGKGAGFRGKFLGKLHISGGYIEYDNRNNIKVVVGDKEIENYRWYSVGTSDYLQRGTGYRSLSNCRNIRYNAEYLRDTLKEYLNKKDFLDNAFVDRWIKE